MHLCDDGFSGELQTIDANDSTTKVKPGAVVLVTGKAANLEEVAFGFAAQGAVAAIVTASDRLQARWDSLAARPLHLPVELQDEPTSELEGAFTMIAE